MTAKKKVFLFGCGDAGLNTVLPQVKDSCDVLGFIDNNPQRHCECDERTSLPVYSPDVLKKIEFDTVIIASPSGLEAITKQLIAMGIPLEKIDRDCVTLIVKPRIIFLEKLAEVFRKSGVSGSVAEGGVFQGEFACQINRIFPDEKCYLFDTFGGFDERDLSADREKGVANVYGTNHHALTSVDLVLQKMPHPERVIIREGFFPETAAGIEDEFSFVNLDFDLYAPIKAGLEFFYPRMVKGGCILLHDYFNSRFAGVEKAVSEFVINGGGGGGIGNIGTLPIGDGMSVAIVKN